MFWHMENLDIVGYDSRNTVHRKFNWELNKDESINYYFKTTIERYLENSKDPKELKIETAYFIAFASTLIGYIYLGTCDFNGVLSLDYAIHKDYRGRKFGMMILRETRAFLIENLENVKKIDLAISKENYYSIQTAIRSNYQFHRKIDDTIHYRL